MYRVAVMGDKDSIYGFAALGLDIFPEFDAAHAADTLRKLAANSYAVVYITEALASAISEEIDRYKSKELPAIILIPGVIGNTGLGLANVSRTVEKAVGSDILSQK